MYSVGAMKDIFAGLLVLVAISEDVVLGEHRIKMEKGYNLQERPASVEEGGPLLIRLVGFCNQAMFCHITPQRTSRNLRNISFLLGTSCIRLTINLYSQIVMDGLTKGEHQPEKHSGRQRERAAG